MYEDQARQTPAIRPYGTWTSPISVELGVTNPFRLGQVEVDRDDTYWTEERPHEGGRVALVRSGSDGELTDAVQAPYSVRSRVYEYGGGSFLVDNGMIYFVNDDDQRVYRTLPAGDPAPQSPHDPTVRFADLTMDSRRQRLLCVMESHGDGREPDHCIAALAIGGPARPEVVVEGSDFYSTPRISPDGRQLCWVQWRHPDMPWDQTELWVADLADDGQLSHQQRIAGGPGESVVQPRWASDNTLFYVCDRGGWWTVWRRHNGVARPLTQEKIEFGRPQWVFHLCAYDVISSHLVVAAGAQLGRWRLYQLSADQQNIKEIPNDFTDLGATVRLSRRRVITDAASPSHSRAMVSIDLDTASVERLEPIERLEHTVEPGVISLPEPVEFSTTAGEIAHAFLYRPQNPDFVGPPDTLPPLLVRAHGGPTAAVSGILDYSIQFWTSRGFAVLDVNYGGSSAYGRAYRERLKGRWGEVDVDDCCAGASFVADRGDVDPSRMVIQGGSAGGYTVLAALMFRDVFRAGASYYGIADLETFARETHKFESHYCERLVGHLPAQRDRYHSRSPLRVADKTSRPVIMFQGRDDAVVPASQASEMFHRVRESGVTCAYLEFDGEGHGLRQAANQQLCLASEFYFYSRLLGFEAGDPPAGLTLHNLPGATSSAGPASTAPR